MALRASFGSYSPFEKEHGVVKSIQILLLSPLRKVSIFIKRIVLDEIFIFRDSLIPEYQRISKNENITERNFFDFQTFRSGLIIGFLNFWIKLTIVSFVVMLTTAQISISRKETILYEAAKLIKEKGYVATTMRDLAGRVGIEASSLYNHIKSKEQILGEICFNLANKFTSEMSEIERLNCSIIDKLKALIKLHVLVNTESSEMASVMHDEWRHLSETKLSDFLHLRENYEAKFMLIIEDGISKNELRKTDSKIALYSMLSSIRWLQHWYTKEREISIAEIQENLIKLLLLGITK